MGNEQIAVDVNWRGMRLWESVTLRMEEGQGAFLACEGPMPVGTDLVVVPAQASGPELPVKISSVVEACRSRRTSESPAPGVGVTVEGGAEAVLQWKEQGPVMAEAAPEGPETPETEAATPSDSGAGAPSVPSPEHEAEPSGPRALSAPLGSGDYDVSGQPGEDTRPAPPAEAASEPGETASEPEAGGAAPELNESLEPSAEASAAADSREEPEEQKVIVDMGAVYEEEEEDRTASPIAPSPTKSAADGDSVSSEPAAEANVTLQAEPAEASLGEAVELEAGLPDEPSPESPPAGGQEPSPEAETGDQAELQATQEGAAEMPQTASPAETEPGQASEPAEEAGAAVTSEPAEEAGAAVTSEPVSAPEPAVDPDTPEKTQSASANGESDQEPEKKPKKKRGRSRKRKKKKA